MRIIISPAKKMRTDEDCFECSALPSFLPRTEQLLKVLQGMSPKALQQLWKCNDKIAAQNVDRIRQMDLYSRLTPAILAYDGIQYQHMGPGAFTDEEMAYVQEHLRILSGFYGAFRPLDGVTPYRLEMQAKLSVNDQKDLYAFWGDSIAQSLFVETDCILNLASKEYSLCVEKYLPAEKRLITCIFGVEKNGKVIEKGTLCKMARGEMVRFLAVRGAESPEEAKNFTALGFRFDPARSDEKTYVFLAGEDA